MLIWYSYTLSSVPFHVMHLFLGGQYFPLPYILYFFASSPCPTMQPRRSESKDLPDSYFARSLQIQVHKRDAPSAYPPIFLAMKWQSKNVTQAKKNCLEIKTIKQPGEKKIEKKSRSTRVVATWPTCGKISAVENERAVCVCKCRRDNS